MIHIRVLKRIKNFFLDLIECMNFQFFFMANAEKKNTKKKNNNKIKNKNKNKLCDHKKISVFFLVMIK
jgi:hypothetical protein